MRRLWAAIFVLVLFAAEGRASCSFQTLKDQAFRLLAAAEPEVKGRAKYVQVLHSPNGGKEKLPPHYDYSFREIPVAISDVETCSTVLVMESRRISKGKLSEPLGGYIRIADRAFGSIWNDFNTQSTTGNPKRIVLGMKWRFFSMDGDAYYVPYSRDLAAAFPQLSKEGEKHFAADSKRAISEIAGLGLADKDSAKLLRELLRVVFLSESIDPFEFKVSGREERNRLLNQPLITLAANGEKAYVLKVSSAGAKGLMQIWGPSCGDLRKRFPEAQLPSDCNLVPGVEAHQKNMVAGGLEILMHRQTLIRFLGPEVEKRADFKRMILASYNGGPGWVIKAYRQHGNDWDKPHFIHKKVKHGRKYVQTAVLSKNSLRGETIDYLKKCDYIRNRQRPEAVFIASGAR